MKALITAGGGTGGGNNATAVAASATPDGSLLIAYIPPAHTGSVTIDMTALTGSVTARWYDPTNGTYTTVAGSPFANTGTRAFTPTGNNSAGQADWVLVLQGASTPDSTAPSTPTGLATQNVTSNEVGLTWTASTDNVGVTGYRVYRNGTQIGTSTSTSYTDTGLNSATTYSYTVSAYDASNNQSGQSAAVNATTQAPHFFVQRIAHRPVVAFAHLRAYRRRPNRDAGPRSARRLRPAASWRAWRRK